MSLTILNDFIKMNSKYNFRFIAYKGPIVRTHDFDFAVCFHRTAELLILLLLMEYAANVGSVGKAYSFLSHTWVLIL